MKGVILCQAPHALIVDLCHHIDPHDIRQAAAMIAAAFPYFPEGTLHVMVVDPGVGSARDIVFAQARTCGFLCPDNGLLTDLIGQGILDSAWRVSNPTLFPDAVSTTFHGRDIIAPVAGFLVAGGVPEKLGSRRAIGDLVCQGDVPVHLDGQGCLQGTVVAVDRFGNVITNIGRDLLTSTGEGGLNQHLIIEAGATDTPQCMLLVSHYSVVPVGELLATIGSRNTLEIAVNRGSASHLMGVAPGASIRITCKGKAG
jgi:S-adenosylmethionine hydrolase